MLLHARTHLALAKDDNIDDFAFALSGPGLVHSHHLPSSSRLFYAILLVVLVLIKAYTLLTHLCLFRVFIILRMLKVTHGR